MSRLGIIQPGRLGDIIICLPIAKYYFDRGYQILWPVLCDYIDIFRDIDYVETINLKCSISNSVLRAKEICKQAQYKELDLSFGFFGSSVEQYHSNTNFAKNFVEAKYKLSNVPIEERWKLDFKRDYSRENSLFKKMIKSSSYVLAHENSSQGNHFFIDGDNIIKVMPIKGYNIFNWMQIIEGAEEIYCIDSSVCNLIESQKHLKDKIKKYIPAKQFAAGWGRTTLENNWQIL
jgi:hypothetical protein